MIQDLNDLYQDQIRDIYSAETQLIDALPKMAASASDDDLRQAFEHHLQETREQRARLERIAASRGFNPDGDTCETMRMLVEEGEKHQASAAAGAVRDALLIATANRVEHYEIASYGVARSFANVLGYDEDARMLDESLDEESAADEKVTKIATGGLFGTGVNEAAAH